MSLISLNNIHKSYGKLTALHNISFSINSGNIVGLLGPNGAGKTTLLRILTGILQADTGNYFFNGQAITKIDYRKIGYLPEERGLYKDMTVADCLNFLAQLKNVPSKVLQNWLQNWLQRFDIEHLAKKKIHELSKGNQQKIQFISAIVHQPDLVILDEPFSGFDAINSKLAIEVIHELNKKGISFILSTHQMHTVENLCSHVIMINKGNLILNGTVDEVKSKYRQNRFRIQGTGQLKQPANTYKIVIADTQNNREIIIEGLPGFSSTEILKELLTSFEITAFQALEPGIEEIFIKTLNSGR